MPYRFVISLTSIGLAMLPVVVLLGCANQEAVAAVDYAKCQRLGFSPGTQYYEMCLSQVQQQRTASTTAPEPLPDQTAAVPSSNSYTRAD
jgi:hypothetical protein